MINLVTQTAFDFAEPFVLSANAQVGYQTLNEKYPIRGDASAGGRFGGDEQFGILIGGSYSKRDFQSFGIFPDDWAAFPGAARDGMQTNINYTDNQPARERLRSINTLDWLPDAHTHIEARGLHT